MVHNSSSGNGTSCGGPVWGHAVSKDFAHWSNLRVALWNDQWWDLDAVYTGSVSIVGGTPAIIYPGICDRPHADCAAHWVRPLPPSPPLPSLPPTLFSFPVLARACLRCLAHPNRGPSEAFCVQRKCVSARV